MEMKYETFMKIGCMLLILFVFIGIYYKNYPSSIISLLGLILLLPESKKKEKD